MFGTIRKHQKWLWLVIITLTIISFVIFFSPYSKMNAGRSFSANLGKVAGHTVSEEAFRNAYDEMRLRYFFSNGRWPADEAERELEQGTFEWLLLIDKQDQFGIHISRETVAEVARGMIHSFQQQAGIGSLDELANLLRARGLSLDDFERFVRHYLGLQELIATVGMSGKLATPDELKAMYIRERQELSTEAVFFNASNYLASVTPTPQAISNFYALHESEYRIPERVQVSYVKFPVTNFWAQAEQYWAKTNLNEQVDMYYQKFGTNLVKGAKTPEETKAKFKEELIRDRALMDARKKGIDFARPLVENEKAQPSDLAVAAKTNDLPVQVTEPFSEGHSPTNLDVGPDFAAASFKLTPQRPIAGPLLGRDGVYVIAYNKVIPSEIPPLDQIRDRVTADYKFEQARNIAVQAGLAAQTALTNAMAQGKTFADACAAANVKPTPLPPFSLSTRSLPQLEERVNVRMLQQMAFSTPVGKVSPFERTMEGGMILYVKGKLPIDDAKMKTELTTFGNEVRRQRQGEAFSEWFSQEFTKNVRSPFLDRLRQQEQERQQRQMTPPNLSAGPARKKS